MLNNVNILDEEGNMSEIVPNIPNNTAPEEQTDDVEDFLEDGKKLLSQCIPKKTVGASQ